MIFNNYASGGGFQPNGSKSTMIASSVINKGDFVDKQLGTYSQQLMANGYSPESYDRINNNCMIDDTHLLVPVINSSNYHYAELWTLSNGTWSQTTRVQIGTTTDSYSYQVYGLHNGYGLIIKTYAWSKTTYTIYLYRRNGETLQLVGSNSFSNGWGSSNYDTMRVGSVIDENDGNFTIVFYRWNADSDNSHSGNGIAMSKCSYTTSSFTMGDIVKQELGTGPVACALRYGTNKYLMAYDNNTNSRQIILNSVMTVSFDGSTISILNQASYSGASNILGVGLFKYSADKYIICSQQFLIALSLAGDVITIRNTVNHASVNSKITTQVYCLGMYEKFIAYLNTSTNPYSVWFVRMSEGYTFIDFDMVSSTSEYPIDVFGSDYKVYWITNPSSIARLCKIPLPSAKKSVGSTIGVASSNASVGQNVDVIMP